MDTSMSIILTFAILGIVVLVAIAAGVWFYLQKQKTKQLRSKFGPEYGRAVRSEGDMKHAEQVLQARQTRVEQLNIKPLTDSEQEEFAHAWEQEQARFVDQPATAVMNADQLVQKIMKARGYPVTDFDQRVADVSVDHPLVVENYRIAHDIAVREENERMSTEELREAMIHYRALFSDLLHDGGGHPVQQVIPNDNARARSTAR